jgi:hypothetical protein
MRQRDRQGHSTVSILFLTLILLSPYLSTFSYATTLTRPSWTEQAMFRFGDEIFFVGQASCVKTSEEGRQQAFAQGVQEILNYTQAQSLGGVRVTTQMVFEDPADFRCPHNTTTVWRLLRMDAIELARLSNLSRNSSFTARQEDSLSDTFRLRVGLTRREVLRELGRPLSIELGSDGSSVLDYQSLVIFIGKNGRLTGWQTTQSPPGNNPDQIGKYGTPRTDQLDLPVLGLNDQTTLPGLNIVYNSERFARPKMVVTQRYGGWPVCAVLDRAEIMAELLDGFRESRPPLNLPAVNAWRGPAYDLYPHRRTSGLWTCREAQLFTPNPHDCRPW